MPRYIVRKATARFGQRPRADDFDWSNDISRPSSLDVPDHEPTFTGLLDADGGEIWRAPNPMGFIHYD